MQRPISLYPSPAWPAIEDGLKLVDVREVQQLLAELQGAAVGAAHQGDA